MKVPSWFIYVFQNQLLTGAKLYKILGFKRLGLRVEELVNTERLKRTKQGLKEAPRQPIPFIISLLLSFSLFYFIYKKVIK